MNYGNLPLVPDAVTSDDALYYHTPDGRYQLVQYRNHRVDIFQRTMKRIGDEPLRLDWDLVLARAPKSEAQARLGVILYPPGSEPSPEYHRAYGDDPRTLRDNHDIIEDKRITTDE